MTTMSRLLFTDWPFPNPPYVGGGENEKPQTYLRNTLDKDQLLLRRETQLNRKSLNQEENQWHDKKHDDNN